MSRVFVELMNRLKRAVKIIGMLSKHDIFYDVFFVFFLAAVFFVFISNFLSSIALPQVMPRLKELSMFRMQQASKTAAPSTAPNDGAGAKTPSKKRKTTDVPMEKQLSAKRQKDALPERESHPGSAQKSGAVDDTQMVTAIPTVLPKSNKAESKIEQAPGDSVSKGDTPAFYTDQCTVFVSNLSLEV